MRQPPPDEWLEDAEQTLDDQIELARTDPVYPPWVQQRTVRHITASAGLPPALGDTLYWLLLRQDPTALATRGVLVGIYPDARPGWMTRSLHSALCRAVDSSVGPAIIWFAPEQPSRLMRNLPAGGRQRSAGARVRGRRRS